MFRASSISVQGRPLKVFAIERRDEDTSRNTIEIVALATDVAQFVGVESNNLLEQLGQTDLCPPGDDGLLDRAALSYVLLQRFPTRWSEICTALSSSAGQCTDHDNDEGNDDTVECHQIEKSFLQAQAMRNHWMCFHWMQQVAATA